MGWVNRNRVLYPVVICVLLGAIDSGLAQTERAVSTNLRGNLVDAAGQPVAGVGVRLYRETYGGPLYSRTREPAGDAVTRADGSFSFGVPTGQYLVQLAASEDQVAEWVAAPVMVQLVPGQIATVTIEVHRGGLLEVVVLEAPGYKRLPQARVDLREAAGDSPVAVVSDAGGTARVRLMPGQYELRDVLGEGYTYEGHRQVITIKEGETRRIAAILAANVQGVVRDPEGIPVAGATLRIVGAGRDEVLSDAQGRFEIAWNRRGQFRAATVFHLVARHEPQNLAATVEIGRDTSWLVVKLQPCPVLAGRVMDAQGRGIGGAWVYVTLEVPDWGDTPLCEEQIPTDADGGFALRAVPPGGSYTVHAAADAYGCGNAVVSTETATDRPCEVGPLTLSPADLSVSGRVLDSTGNPVAQAMIYGWGPGQPHKLNTQTDAEGRFTLGGVCAGRLHLRADAHLGGGKRLRAQGIAEAGATDIEIRTRDPFVSYQSPSTVQRLRPAR